MTCIVDDRLKNSVYGGKVRPQFISHPAVRFLFSTRSFFICLFRSLPQLAYGLCGFFSCLVFLTRDVGTAAQGPGLTPQRRSWGCPGWWRWSACRLWR